MGNFKDTTWECWEHITYLSGHRSWNHGKLHTNLMRRTCVFQMSWLGQGSKVKYWCCPFRRRECVLHRYLGGQSGGCGRDTFSPSFSVMKPRNLIEHFSCLGRSYLQVSFAGRWDHMIKLGLVCCRWNWISRKGLTHPHELPLLTFCLLLWAHKSDLITGAEIIQLGPWTQMSKLRSEAKRQKETWSLKKGELRCLPHPAYL